MTWQQNLNVKRFVIFVKWIEIELIIRNIKMETSIKSKILNYLQDGEWAYGGTLEREVGIIAQCKQSNVGRRCRELENEKKVERRLVKVNGLNVVQYRLKVDQVMTPFFALSGANCTSNKDCYSRTKFKICSCKREWEQVNKQLTINL